VAAGMNATDRAAAGRRSAVLAAAPVPVTVIVLTFNEERNLAVCLESVKGWARAIFVVDSGSTDGTVRIAETLGATVVTHAFETHARQWVWAIESLPLETEWVLGLDADQRVTPLLRREIGDVLGSHQGEAAAGYFVKRRQIFRGRWIKHGGYYPKYLLKLFRRSRVVVDVDELVDHHFRVDGPTRKLGGDIVEDNQNEAAIAEWTAKHNRYATLQAQHELRERASAARVGPAAIWASPDDRTQWMKQTWRRFPLFVRPCLYVFYRYVIRLGFLDGKQGFIFHVLQGFWYRLLVDINIDELRAR
jgi:glycosyltransferase involved in cell wall biosynthesis